MRFQERTIYPFPADTVIRVFCDKDYFLTKYSNAGARNIELLEHSLTDGVSTIKISRDVHVDVNVPAFARKFVPQQITIVQADNWHVERMAGWIGIHFKGMPAEVRCDLSLKDGAGGSILDLDFQVKIQVPLIGDKLAVVLAEDLKKKFSADSAEAQKVMAEIAQRYS